MRNTFLAALVGLALGSLACVSPADTASWVHDLRVLGVRLEPPEIMGPSCDGGIAGNAGSFFTPTTYTALIADPGGGGRTLSWTLRACANPNDHQCAEDGASAQIASGTSATDGELSLTIQPALTVVGPNSTPLLEKVLAEDPYQGLGGINMPLVLHLTGGGDDLYAQKLMVFSCKLFPDQKANTTPELPGMELPDAGLWPDADAGVIETFNGKGPFTFTAPDLTALEVPYVVPALNLTEVHLTESWKIYYYSEAGFFSPENTGGTNQAGLASKNFSSWTPRDGTPARDVRFWFVVDDGRGGESWLERTAHYAP